VSSETDLNKLLRTAQEADEEEKLARARLAYANREEVGAANKANAAWSRFFEVIKNTPGLPKVYQDKLRNHFDKDK